MRTKFYIAAIPQLSVNSTPGELIYDHTNVCINDHKTDLKADCQ